MTEMTKQYIAVDSTMANPTNKVLVMVLASSGCWAIAPNARARAIPSPIAGPIEPMAMVIPAVIIETAPIISILFIFLTPFLLFYLFRLIFYPCSRGNINRGQHGKDISLYLTN